MEIIDLALTRAQLLSGNNSNGVTLPGQPQGVIAGAGITISTTGIISVNASTVTGLVKLNNPLGYNSYVWPGADGTSGEFLQTDGAGNLGWATPQGFAVVTVQPSPAPVPAEVGELWFDCSNGTLNVYQNCVGTPSPNWFNVAQPGLPVEPGNTGATPGFVSGTGTQADPYDCTVTTTGSGTTVQIIQTVTVTSLAPFQYVPIVDLNAVANGGRFSFTNNYADASGNLTFDILFTDNPASPSGTPYTAAIKVGYGSAYIQAIVNVVAALVVTGGSIAGPLYVGQQLTYTPGVPSGGSTPYGSPTIKWFADGVQIGSASAATFTLTGAQLGKQITASTTYTDASSQTATGTSAAVGPVLAAPAALTITSPGSITPATNVVVGNTLNYTAGTFTGGIPTVTPSWKWQRNGVDIAGVAANATSYLTVSADAGKSITVRYTVTDSATPTAATQSASTTAVTPTETFPNPVWNPGPAGGLNTIPGLISGQYNGTGTTITATGCIEVSTDGTNFSQSEPITSGQTLYSRWITSPACGDAASGTPLSGTVTDGTYTNSYGPVSVNRVPTPGIADLSDSNVALGATTTKAIASPIAGLNTTAYVTYVGTSTGTTIQAATAAGGPFTTLATSGTGFSVTNGQTLYIRQTVGSSTSVGYTAIIRVGDGTNAAGTYDEFTYTATTVTTAVFPGLTFNNGGAPNAAPETVTGVAGGGTLGTLNGVADSNSWPAGFGTTLSSPVSGANPTMKFRKNATGLYVTSGLSVVPTDVLNLAWNEAYLATVADGATATGSITGTVSGTAYTNSFTLGVKRSAVWSVPPNPGNAATSTPQTTNPIAVNNFNVPVTVSFAAPSTGTLMGNVIAVVDGVSTNINPITTTVTLNPGESFEVLGDTGGTGGDTYGVKITIGTSAAQDWLVTTSSVPNAIQAPVMSPTGSGLNPAANSPAGITLGGGNYTIATGSPGPHTSSDWQLFANVGSTTKNPETSAIVSVAQNSASGWTSQTTAPSFSYAAATYNGTNKYVIAGQNIGNNASVWDSPDGVNWTSRLITPSQATINGIAYGVVSGSGLYVACCQGATILTSSNLTSWSSQSISGVGSLFGIFYGGGQFVTVGQTGAGRIFTSPDGVNWTSQTSGTTNQLQGVTYGNSQYVVVGFSGTIVTSPDGVTWTSRTSGTTGTLRGVAYGNSQYVAVGNNGTILTSPDGVTWTSRTSGTTNTLLGVTYVNSGYVVVGGSGTILVSADGITWTSQTSGNTNTLSGVIYGGGQALIAGDNSTVLTSSNPLATTTLTLTNTTGLSDMVVGDTVVEVGGGADATGTITAITPGTPSITVAPSSAAWTGGSVATAKDTSRTVTTPNQPLESTNTITSVGTGPASSWTSQTSSFGTTSIGAITFGNSTYVAAGNGGKLATSPDGVNWTQQTSGFGTAGIQALAYGNNLFVAGGSTGTLTTSTNGTAWTSRTSNFGVTGILCATYGNGKYVIGGGGGTLATSTDGTTWNLQTSNFPGANSILGLAYGAGKYVAVGAGPSTQNITYSSDGTSWTQVADSQFASSDIYAVTFGNGLFVAVGQSGKISTSPDGVTWTARTTTATVDFYGVGYFNGTFIAGGNVSGGSAILYTSSDGITWTSQSSGSGFAIRAVGSGSSLAIFAGNSGTLFTNSSPGPTTALTISGANTDGFAVGNLISNGLTTASAASGTITAINGTTVTVAPQSANWAGGQNLYRGQAIVNVANNANLVTYLVAQSLLTPSTTYYSRARYSASSTSTVSPWANWASFSTASAFVPPPGTAMSGGYFGGQINDGGIVYNLIVAPKSTGQSSFNDWKTSPSVDNIPSTAFWENSVYGFPVSQAGNSATYPPLQYARTLTIGGYNDWYLPAKNELEVLYYFLKPTTAPPDNNSTSSGSNANAVAPEPVSTNYTATSPAQTSSSLFVSGTGAQAFNSDGYWTSTQVSASSSVWYESFTNGTQGSYNKNGAAFPLLARAIRREYANAPVAIGAAYGGGYFAGQYQDGGVTYNLIVAPVTSGALNGQYGGSTASLVQWKTVSGSDTNPPSQNAVYGGTTTTTFANAQHPLFDWCENNATGPNGGAGIGGFTDWYIPAQNELAILVYNLAPSWTTASLFKASQPQVFDTSNYYWSSTESSSDTLRAWTQWFSNAFEFAPMKDNASGFFARAVRRVPA